ncbi:glycosyltransferase family 39 protein [Sphaerimonospora cavernae]|uniref:Glycosyltransferase family 39 protein n=1 Tax=Sphaerimonospora cavernae TaxID=1740611 RepID=A0ABV6UBM3_9ACTN
MTAPPSTGTTSLSVRATAPSPPPVAWIPVGSAALATVFVLSVTSGQYGYHRDELYFRMLRPAWGYVDQPPLTPLLARAATAVFGDALWAMRVPAVACVAVAVLLTALTARELGGGPLAQGLAAWGFGFGGFPLVTGHVLLTATVDLAVWAAVILFVVRALLRGEPRWWLAVGAVAGLSMFNKLLIVLPLLGLAVGLLAVGPRRLLRSPWLWGGVALALVLGSPNLVYQATHGWPQISMAGAIARNKGEEARILLLPFQLVLFGIPLTPVWVAGLVAVLRRPAWRPVRALAIAYLVVLVVTWMSGGQIYYPFGLLAFLFAAGCVAVAEWIARGRLARSAVVGSALAINAVVSASIALPIVPVDILGRTPIPKINQTARDQVGWTVYVRTVLDVYDSLPAQDRARAVFLTDNYGEAGALSRYLDASLRRAVYSGQNELWNAGPPPQDSTVVVAWTQNLGWLSRLFATCEQRAGIDNGVDVDNDEQGGVVAVCRDPVGGWSAAWPRLQHYD